VQGLAGAEPGGDLAWEVVGFPGHLQVAAAQHLPVVGVRAHVVEPRLPEARAERLERFQLCGPAHLEDERGAVVEPVLTHAVERHEVELPLQGAAGLAEQVADHGWEQRVADGVPGEPVGGHRGEGTAERALLHQRDRMAELGQSQPRGQATEAAADHHHPGHGRTLGGRLGAGLRGGAGGLALPPPPAAAYDLAEQVEQYQAAGEQDRGDGRGGPWVVDR